MRLEDYVWLQENESYMRVSQFIPKPDRNKIYEIYNNITGENKRPNGCGRCLTNTLKRIRFEYEKYENTNENQRSKN